MHVPRNLVTQPTSNNETYYIHQSERVVSLVDCFVCVGSAQLSLNDLTVEKLTVSLIGKDKNYAHY